MKTTFLKTILPAAFLALGVAGAIAGQQAPKGSLVLEDAFSHVGPDPCNLVDECQRTMGNPCTIGSEQLWGKASESSTTCTIKLYRP